jgi:hypothetical protein
MASGRVTSGFILPITAHSPLSKPKIFAMLHIFVFVKEIINIAFQRKWWVMEHIHNLCIRIQ